MWPNALKNISFKWFISNETLAIMKEYPRNYEEILAKTLCILVSLGKLCGHPKPTLVEVVLN